MEIETFQSKTSYSGDHSGVNIYGTPPTPHFGDALNPIQYHLEKVLHFMLRELAFFQKKSENVDSQGVGFIRMWALYV